MVTEVKWNNGKSTISLQTQFGIKRGNDVQFLMIGQTTYIKESGKPEETGFITIPSSRLGVFVR